MNFKGHRLNLSVRTLLEHADTLSDPVFHGKLSDAVDAAVSTCAFAVPWRHRRIAHFDLQTALNKHAEPLQPYERRQIVDGIKAIEQVLDTVSLRYTYATTAFGVYEASSYSVDRLIQYLTEVAAREAEAE